MTQKITRFLLAMACLTTLTAQNRKFSAWDATAFCEPTVYHPFVYVNTDNNWEIIQTLQTPRTTAWLDSMGILYTRSQLLLLQIEGLIERKGDTWHSLMSVFDSLQTLEARKLSLDIANELYPKIKGPCITFIDFLKQENFEASIYSILFAYVLDGKVWESINTFKEVNIAATWEGACWAFYFPRTFSSGTNTTKAFHICWSKKAPAFVFDELDHTFMLKFQEDYSNYGRIVSSDLLDKSLSLGLIHADGSLRIPVLDSQDAASRLNILSDAIISPIIHYFKETNIVYAFQQQFGIRAEQERLAVTMLYHEVMWDLIDLLLADQLIRYPLVWEDHNKQSTYSVVFLRK